MEDKPRNNEELEKLEEALPRLEECELEKSVAIAQGVGCDGFHPKVSLDLTKVQKVKWCSSWKRWNIVENGRNKPVRRCSS